VAEAAAALRVYGVGGAGMGIREVAVAENVPTCPSCRLAVSDDARFCPNCGTRLDATPSSEPSSELSEPGSIAYTKPEPKLFGVLLPVPTFILACIVLAGALFSFISGGVVLGVMLLAFAAALFLLFYGAAERNPESGIARGAVDAVERVTGWWRFSRESASAWSGAGRRVVRLKQELRPLRAERRQVQLALGQAAYEQDEAEVASLRARIAELEDAIGERERESAEAVARARHRVDDERLAVQPTEHIPPDQPADADAPTVEAAEPQEPSETHPAEPVEDVDEEERKAS
jgi:zinc-ribbon domain